MYDPKIGQFISEDPIEFNAGDPNLRRYAGNNTTNATDPSGYNKVLNTNLRAAPVIMAFAADDSETEVTGLKEILKYLEWRIQLVSGEGGAVHVEGRAVSYATRCLHIGRDQSKAYQESITVHEFVEAILGRLGYGGNLTTEWLQNLSTMVELSTLLKNNPDECTMNYVQERLKYANEGATYYKKLKELTLLIENYHKGKNGTFKFSETFEGGTIDVEKFKITISLVIKNGKIEGNIIFVFID